MSTSNPLHRVPGHTAITRGVLPALLLLACLFGLPSVLPAAAAAPDYDLTVIVFASDPAKVQVAASYSHPVKHEAIQAGVTALGRELNLPVSALSMDEAPLMPGSNTVGTSAEFNAPRLVVSGQPLPLAAILRALPEWKHARVAFATGTGFAFAGPADGTGVGAAVARLVSRGASYEYDVEEGQQGTTTPARIIPRHTAAAQPATRTRKATPPLARIVLLVAAAGGAAAWIAFRPLRRKKLTRG